MSTDNPRRTRSSARSGVAGGAELAGTHVLLTGVTGFLGQAMLERLLSGYPDTRVSVLIRPRGGRSAADRLAGMLRKNVFRPLRERLGPAEVARMVTERVTVIAGDLTSVVLPADLDVVIHGASTVSFDPPVDEAFRTNVSGVAALYEALAQTGTAPHVVHVSTAYVAGTRKGVVPEAALDHTVDWRLELEMALAARAEVERDSRRPEVLRRLLNEAGEEHAKAGPQSTSADAERLRGEWVTSRLVDYGRLRAQSLGWPDVYTLTKALGERVAEQLWAHPGASQPGASQPARPLSVVRPAIVESALRHPYPGWIDGFKMTDPLIIAYSRGVLREFPGLPDSVLDIIPVDLVVNATLAAAARPPRDGPAYLHVSSGASNPLTFRNMYVLCREYFDNHPMPDGDRSHIPPPTWRFPGRHQVELMLRTGERAAALAEKVLLRLPPSARSREWLTRLGRRQQELTQLREYSDLYGVYARAEVIYEDHRLRELHAALPPDRAGDHGCDPTVIDWRHYLQEVHCPAITATVRRAGERRGQPGTARRATPPPALPERTDVAAVFDLEGTIVASNIVEAYLWARLSTLPRSQWFGELADLARNAPRYLYAERWDRGELLRAFLRRYAGARAADLRALSRAALGDALLHRVLPEATRQIRRHRAAGHRTVLITGAVDIHVEPLTVLFDEVVASRMQEDDGVLTGFLEAPPLVDEARAAWLRQYAQRHEVDLTRSYAYADSYSDRPLLEAVGHPRVVNPDAQLFRYARRQRWTVHRWGAHTGGLLDVMVDVAWRDVRGARR